MINLFEPKRLNRSSDKDIVFNTLDIKKNNKYGFFHQMTDIYIFALALGLKRKKRMRLLGQTSEPIHVSYFNDEQKKFFDMVILYSETGSLDSLDKSSEENVLQIKKTIEEYANGGLEILREKIEVHPENAFNIIKLLVDQELKSDLPENIDDDLDW